MKEYIERELLLIGVDNCISALHAKAKGDPIQEAAIKLVEVTRGYIASLSAADVAPVRHGRWIEEHGETFIPIEYDTNGEPILHNYVGYHCSLCGRYEPVQEPYCNCGALMDGKEDDHD